MYKVSVIFKKGKPATFEDVTSIKIGCKPAGHIYQGEELLKGLYPSNEDLVITYSQGVTVIAKNTFESLTITGK